MEIKIRKYKEEDFNDFANLTKENHEFIVSLDSHNLLHVGKKYAKYFARKYIKDAKESGGQIFIAEVDNKISGCIVTLIIKSTKIEKEKFRNIKVGRISNLVVNKDYRKNGIGRKLIKIAESYLKKSKCKFIKLGVFAPNINARSIYSKLGYEENSVHLIKKI